MAIVWWACEGNSWEWKEVDAEWIDLTSIPPRFSAHDSANAEMGAQIAHSPADAAEADGWFLMHPRDSRVWCNGRPSVLGMRVLIDRDEIRVEGVGRFYFSTETLPKSVPYPKDADPAMCGACAQQINPGDWSCTCPDCGVCHHDTARCGACSHPLDPGIEFSKCPSCHAWFHNNRECGACTHPLTPGTEATECPACHELNHRTTRLRCWGDIPTCSHCAQPTAQDEPGWRPDDL